MTVAEISGARRSVGTPTSGHRFVASPLVRALSPLSELAGRWRKWTLGAIAFGVFATGMGVLSDSSLQSGAQFRSAHGSLLVTRQRISATLGELASIRQDLAHVDRVVAKTRSDLTGDTTQLRRDLDALTEARAGVTTRGSAITNLQSCLGGVERSLNALTVGDQGSAFLTLSSVTAACQEAVAADG
jgi:hypothetical protein